MKRNYTDCKLFMRYEQAPLITVVLKPGSYTVHIKSNNFAQISRVDQKQLQKQNMVRSGAVQ